MSTEYTFVFQEFVSLYAGSGVATAARVHPPPELDKARVLANWTRGPTVSSGTRNSITIMIGFASDVGEVRTATSCPGSETFAAEGQQTRPRHTRAQSHAICIPPRRTLILLITGCTELEKQRFGYSTNILAFH
jgi:hypothetical protein